TATVDIFGSTIDYVFTSNKSQGNFKNGVTGPGCDDCTITISDHNTGVLTVNDGEIVCILNGASHTGGVKMRGGTLKVCGTLTLQWINGDGTIIINDDGAFISNSLNMNDSDLTIENYSDAFMVGAGPNIKGTFKNWGYIALAGANINSGGSFYNYGIIAFSNNYNNNEYTYNEGIMNLAGSVANNNGAIFENHCRVNVAGNFNNNSTLENYSYMDINGNLTLNNGGGLQMYDEALIDVIDLTVNEDIVGNGSSYSKIVIAGNTTINSAIISGNIDLCDEDGIETNNGTITSSVTFCEASIAETFCNPGSNGSGGGGSGDGDDSDGDGVADDFDDYPNDANRAFNNYYPDENTFGTLAYEDLWPYKGDYDFNDLVVDYRFNTVTNATDNAIEIFITLKVKAIGAAYKNGFGLQFPFSPDLITDVSGDFSHTQNLITLTDKNLEANQDNAVIIFFDNAFDLLPHPGDGTGVNTRIGASYVEPQETNFVVSFAYPVNPANLGTAPFNPFIFVHGDRGREIHLKNNAPTNLIDMSMFNTGQDASIPSSGLYFITTNNLPWGINMVEGFDYPIEKSPIIDAYNYFAQWAESGGNQYPDWYSDEAGYRNDSYIYSN
ncbi:MAG: LruC domain-containing protein, partial [Bacteroidales bacterium]|nr:LruC domain-containing protein [Bacteroidales bacterium]